MDSGQHDVGEDGQGQLAVPEHVVVEAPDVEGGTFPTLPLPAQALDLAPSAWWWTRASTRSAGAARKRSRRWSRPASTQPTPPARPIATSRGRARRSPT